MSEHSLPTVEYSAASQLRSPKWFLRSSLRSLRASGPLAARLFRRNLLGQYRQSLLGFSWIILPAIAQTAIWLLLNAADVINTGNTEIPYPLFVLVGTLLWQTFTESLFAPNGHISKAATLLSRANFPPESLLIAALAECLLNAVVRIAIVIAATLVFGNGLHVMLLLAPVPILLLITLGFGIGLLLTPFGMLYHDVSRFTIVVVGFWMLITPVAFVLPTSGVGRMLAIVNPVTPILSWSRDLLTGVGGSPSISFYIVAPTSITLLILAWLAFRLSLPHIVDRFGS